MINFPIRYCLLVSFRHLLVILVSCSLMCTVKSGYGQLSKKYGRSRGVGYADSVNGTSLFTEMYRARGFDVTTKKYLPSNLERYETIVWFPDDFDAPAEATVALLQKWLDEDTQRLLIYVGRDYSAETDYWFDVVQMSTGVQRSDAMRQYALSRSQQFVERDYSSRACRWFDIETGNIPQAIDVETNFEEAGLSTGNNPTMKWGRSRLAPPVGNSFADKENLIEIGSEPFVFQLGNWKGGSVIVVNNGSILLNYPMTEAVNREVAAELISRSGAWGSVLFLESGPGGLMNSSSGRNTQWSWVSQPPMRYIVPHVLVLGAIGIFCFYPILGRPRQGVQPAPNRFRKHLEAIAVMLSNTDNTAVAKQAIENYQRTQHKDSG